MGRTEGRAGAGDARFAPRPSCKRWRHLRGMRSGTDSPRTPEEQRKGDVAPRTAEPDEWFGSDAAPLARTPPRLGPPPPSPTSRYFPPSVPSFNLFSRPVLSPLTNSFSPSPLFFPSTFFSHFYSSFSPSFFSLPIPSQSSLSSSSFPHLPFLPFLPLFLPSPPSPRVLAPDAPAPDKEHGMYLLRPLKARQMAHRFARPSARPFCLSSRVVGGAVGVVGRGRGGGWRAMGVTKESEGREEEGSGGRGGGGNDER